MKSFNENIADNAKVEMIHVSLDQSEDAAEGWAAKEKFPWFTILPDDVKRSGLREFKSTNSVPEYALLDASGKRLGSGSATLKKAADLTK